MAENEKRHGRQYNQKMKPYFVFQYLMKNTDENHAKSTNEIRDYLKGYDIYAERRSIYRDIDEINKALLIIEEDVSYDEAEEMLYDDESYKTIVYDKHQKGFYVRQRHFELDDIRLLAECIYSAKFISKDKSEQLIDVVCDFVSEPQAEKIKHNAFLTDRVKTNNKSTLSNISLINTAMTTATGEEPHTPERITFKYLKYSLDNVSQQVDRRKGDRYKVSPFQLLISDGNYYLLAFDDKSKKMRTYRVDRMRDMRYTGEPRDGEDEFKKIDLRNYTQRVFSMFGGELKRVSMLFINPLLDTVIEKLGTKDVIYTKVDDNHFSVSAKVEISDQFFGWLLGFGKRARLTYPDETVAEFKNYIDKIREMY